MPIQDLGGDKPTDRPAPPPPPSFTPDKEQDLGGDRPTTENGPDDEKVVDLDLPPPPKAPPPSPPSFSPDPIPKPGPRPEPPPSDTIQDLGGDKQTPPPSFTPDPTPAPGPRPEGPHTVDHVPAYDQMYPGVTLGCTPVAVASVLGYWDQKGYDKLFNAEGWDALKETEKVAEEINSQNHMNKYYGWPSPDNLSIEDTDHLSIADFLETSADVQKLGGELFATLNWDGGRDSDRLLAEDKAEERLKDGESITAQILEAVPEYAGQAGYSFSAWAVALPEWSDAATVSRGFEVSNLEDLWDVLKKEIDNSRPLVASVDAKSDGIAKPNHSVPVVGYWEKSDGHFYGYYDNWHENQENDIQWAKFEPPAADVGWGVASLYTIAPEPASPIAFDPSRELPGRRNRSADPPEPAPCFFYFP